MQAKLTQLLGQVFLKFLLPYLGKEIMEELVKIYDHIIIALAYKKATPEAQAKYDAVKKNPATKPEDLANAYQDLINAKPDL